MTAKRISELNNLTTAASNDLIPIVDVNEENLSIKTKKITVSNLLKRGVIPYQEKGEAPIAILEDGTLYLDYFNNIITLYCRVNNEWVVLLTVNN